METDGGDDGGGDDGGGIDESCEYNGMTYTIDDLVSICDNYINNGDSTGMSQDDIDMCDFCDSAGSDDTGGTTDGGNTTNGTTDGGDDGGTNRWWWY